MKETSYTDGVILLHALMLGQRSLRSLERRLQKEGYTSLNIVYPSTRLSIENLVEHIHPIVEPFIKKTPGDIHFVGHSLGGLLARAYVTRYRPRSLGRIVQLGSPNQGSEAADFVKNFWLYKKLSGLVGQQLGTHNTALEQVLGPVNYELGSIAGSKNFLFFTQFLFKKANDGIVSVESTRARGMKDHIVLPVEHIFFPQYPCVQQQVIHFLKKGEFFRDKLEGIALPSCAT